MLQAGIAALCALTVAVLWGCPALAQPAVTTEQPPLVLWYDQPATVWESEALPLGNGFIGAMVFGGVERERIQINEKHFGQADLVPMPAMTAVTAAKRPKSCRNTWRQPARFCKKI